MLFILSFFLNCINLILRHSGSVCSYLRCSFIWSAKPISPRKSLLIKWAVVFLDLLSEVCNIRACIVVWQWRCTIAVAFSALPYGGRSTWQAVLYRITLSKLTFPITLIHYWIRLYKEPIQYVAIEHIIKEEIKTLTFEELHYPVFSAIALLSLSLCLFHSKSVKTTSEFR